MSVEEVNKNFLFIGGKLGHELLNFRRSMMKQLLKVVLIGWKIVKFQKSLH